MQPKVISSNDLVCSQSGISHRLFLLFHTVRWMKKLFVSNCSQKAWWSQWIIIVINKIIRSLNNFCKGVFNSAIIHFYSACWQLPYFIEISMNLRNHKIIKANTKTLSLYGNVSPASMLLFLNEDPSYFHYKASESPALTSRTFKGWKKWSTGNPKL